MDVIKVLAEQMDALGQLGAPFAHALKSAQNSGASAEFLQDGFALQQQLTGRPGAGAPDCLRDAPNDLASTQAFLAKWTQRRALPGYKNALIEAERTAKALMDINETIRGLHGRGQQDVQTAAEMGHDVSRILRGEVPRSAWIGGILVAVVILLAALIAITVLRSG